jgi:hypothetical protein
MINVWNPNMVATFRALHRGGAPFAEIAAQMSAIFGTTISKNACIGKARRLELPMRASDGQRVPLRQPAKKVPKKPVRIDAPIPPPAEPEPEPEPEIGVSIYQLGNGVCRWPLGRMEDRPPYRYCGHTAPIEESYCAEHRAISYNRPRPF